MENDVNIAKIDAARRQLETAIELYFQGGDVVSVHTLAAAAREILADLCEHREVEPFFSQERMLKELVKPEFRDMLYKALHKAENFFKHADRDPDKLLAFNPKQSEFIILECVETYVELTKEFPALILAFRTWWMVHNRSMLAKPMQDLLATLGSLQYTEYEKARFIQDFMAARYGRQPYSGVG